MRTTLKSIKHVGIKDVTSVPDLNTESFKFAPLSYALRNTNKFISDLIESCIIGDRKGIMVDVKVHDLKKGDSPALEHWHIDCCNSPHYRGREEHNHLYITGVSYTEFLKNDIEVDLPDNPKYNTLLKDCESVKIEAGKIYSYGRYPHRATPAVEDGTRLLIRVTETDNIQGFQKGFKPTYVKH